MLRLEGELFMIVQDQYRDTNAMYRFDGEIAVPAVFFAGKHPWQVRGTWLPPNRPPEMHKFLWRDGSGSRPPDGHFHADEYQELEAFVWGHNSWSKNGDHWNVPTHGNRIVHYPFQGLDENGDENGLRVESVPIVHRSRRPKKAAKTGEKVEIWITPYKKGNWTRNSTVTFDKT